VSEVSLVVIFMKFGSYFDQQNWFETKTYYLL